MRKLEILFSPEVAIRAFETINKLQVVVHDLTSKLWPFLAPERFQHCSPLCRAVKTNRDWACRDFEIHRLRPCAQDIPEGRYHVCHAGLLEWVVPVFIEDRLAWLLFAGQRQPKGVFRHLIRDSRTTRAAHAARSAPPGVDEEHAMQVLEGLRQLRSRLLQWYQDAEPHLHLVKGTRRVAGDLPAKQRLLIERHIFSHHARDASVAGLAHKLGLSESRSMHLVKEIFGRSYIKLVNEMRLRTAASLLRETSLSVLNVCLASGFRDVSHFHRTFRRRFGVTPRDYRFNPLVRESAPTIP
jgi:AraC-like DNA-binding protein